MKISRRKLTLIENEARKYFKGASGCHDWTHVERVRDLALKIGRQEKANLEVLEVSSLLHDIGRREEMKSKGEFCHAEKSAELARKILDNFKIDKEVIDNILQSIISHRYRNNHIPTTIEAKVLYDADKLDSIGAIGVARTFLFAGHSGSGTMYTRREEKIARSKKDFSYTKEDSGYLEYVVKLKHIKDKVLTKTGKRIARERHKFMKEYFKRFWEEIESKK